MRARTLLLLAVGLLISPTLRAQVGGGSAPSAAGGPSQLAQFQPGLSPLGSNLDLNPGGSVRLAMYCIDLFGDTPTDHVAFTAPAGDATVMLASGLDLSLGDALEAGMLRARGSGPGDPP